MALELDHIFCMVDDLDQVSEQLERDGWLLDSGSIHAGEGTRNRRVLWEEQHLELLCVVDELEARSSPLRLDRRADWRTTGASPFGLGLRGSLPLALRNDYWLHQEQGAGIWMHRDNERASARPLVFVVEARGEQLERRRPRTSHRALLGDRDRPSLQKVCLTGPDRCALPPYAGPAITQALGPPHLELVCGSRGGGSRVDTIITLSR